SGSPDGVQSRLACIVGRERSIKVGDYFARLQAGIVPYSAVCEGQPAVARVVRHIIAGDARCGDAPWRRRRTADEGKPLVIGIGDYVSKEIAIGANIARPADDSECGIVESADRETGRQSVGLPRQGNRTTVT